MNNIDILYSESMKEFEIKSHFHNSYEIIYIKSGCVDFVTGDKQYTVQGQNILFISNFENHRLKLIAPPYKRFLILIQPEYLHRILNDPVLISVFKQRPDSFVHMIPLNPAESEKIEHLIQNISAEIKKSQAFHEVAAGAYLQLMLAMLYRNHSGAFPGNAANITVKNIMDIQRYMEENYLQDIMLQDIARMFHMDMYYLSHLFRKMTGYSFKEYLILQRLSQAKNLLYNTNESITTVCNNCGFNNVNHFIRIFRKYEGITPLKYRQKHQSNE